MPPIKAIEQAQFGGVDSRSNPVTMPQNRWLVCKNWIPRPDGHLELREGYVVRVFNQLGPSSVDGGIAGGPAVYSLTPYTVAVPGTYGPPGPGPPPPVPAYNPVTGLSPPASQLISQVIPNGTRAALYWQKSASSQATANIKTVACTIQGAGVPELAIYQVDSTARFLLGHNATVQGVTSNGNTPVNFFNGGPYVIVAIGPGTITLDLGTSPAARSRKPQPRLPPIPSQPPPVVPPTLVSPSFSLSPGSVNFGNIPAGVVSTVSVTLTYHLGSPSNSLPGTWGSFSMSNPAFYVTGVSLPVSGMVDGQSVTFQVNINPSSPTSQTGVMVLETSAGTYDITLAADAQAANITVSPTQLTFPNTPVGQTAPAQTVTVTNGTGSPVTFYGPPTFSNPDFKITVATNFEPAVTVPDGGSFSFDLVATPSVAGTETGTCTFENSDINFNKIVLALEVTGTSAGSGGGGGGGGGTPPPPNLYPENYGGSGGTITAVDTTPGPPVPLLVPLTSGAGSALLPPTFPMKGMPIQSTALWHYALGSDGYLYMCNGIDFKFFDGVCFRDVGLPVLTQDAVKGITVYGGMSVPNPEDVLNVSFSFVPATDPPPTQPNAISSFMYMAYFDKQNNVLAPSTNPLSGQPFPNGNTAPPDTFLQVNNLPLPVDGHGNSVPGGVILLYYPAEAAPILQPNALCNFYPHIDSYNSKFPYRNQSDPSQAGVSLPGSPSATYMLKGNESILFNPGYGQAFPGWTGDTAGNTSPMEIAGVTAAGKWDNSLASIWPGDGNPHTSATTLWCMTLTGKISIPAAGDYTFIFMHDDGAMIGFGGGATHVSGNIEPNDLTLTAERGFPVICSRARTTTTPDTFIVNFPGPGIYEFEIDYVNWETRQTCCLYNGDGTVILPGVAPTSPRQASVPSFLTQDYGQDNATLSASTAVTTEGTTAPVNVNLPNHGFQSGDVIVLALHKHPSKTPDYTPPYEGVSWRSNGPFAITVIDANNFTFNTPEAALYDGAIPITVYRLVQVVPPVTNQVIDTDNTGWPKTCENGVDTNQNGQVLLPGPLDYINSATGGLNNLLPASAVGGTQPGYMFWAAIYDPITGHVGNRVQLGERLNNTTPTTAIIDGLPDLTKATGLIQTSQDPARNSTDVVQGKIPTIPLPTWDPEWRILIGRTGDGGEIPYACTDADGNWITTLNANQTSVTITSGTIDNNAELPFNNYPPPRSVPPGSTFANFWREGDRLCGSLKDSPFVYRSGSQVDATTGIFVGLPAQSWDPSRSETFPTAESIIGGFEFMQESWVFTRNDSGQLSELSGEVSWNGPYNFGIVGPWAFAKGWQSLPYWVSHDRQLCTILPGGNGPIAISTEYEKTLLARIGDEYDSSGNPLMYMQRTQVTYFRDPVRLVDCLRIKCVDNTGAPFTVIHDFNLRDDASPYGQAYLEEYLGPLAVDYQEAYIRDSMARSRIWATASDGQIYQFYSGGLDNVDYYDGTVGEYYTAEAISLRYMGGERTVARTLEWYGDNEITWFIYENMLNVTNDSNTWVEVTYEMRPFPGDAQSAHFIADIQRPEMIHCYLWAQLTAHPADTPNPADPMALSTPYPHIPLEQYGRLYLAAPWLGTTRGR